MIEITTDNPRFERATRLPHIQLWEIAQRVLMVTEIETSGGCESSMRLDENLRSSAFTLAQIIAASPDLIECITRSTLARCRLVSEPALSWAALAEGRCGKQTTEALAGSTLLLITADFCDTVRWSEIEGLRRLRVSRLMMPHPYFEDGSVISLSMRATSEWRERIDLFLLKRAAIGRETIGRAWPERGLMWVAGPTQDIPADEKEMSDRFALFEGTRQLPPLPVPHASIRRLGNGRYSVWGNHLFFSSTAGGPPKSIWMVPKNPSTQRRLMFSSEVLAPLARARRPPFLEQLSATIAADDQGRRVSSLKPGDPVVVLTHALPPGGAERQWCYLAGELKQMGYAVHFVTLFPLDGQNRHYLPLLASEGVEVTQLDQAAEQRAPMEVLRSSLEMIESGDVAAGLENPFGPRLRALVDLFDRLKPRAVFAQLDHSNLMAGSAGLLASIPRTILSFRNYNPTHFSYLANDWHQPLYSLLARSPRILLTGNSRASNADYADWIGVDERRVKLVPNAIDIANIRSGDARSLQRLRDQLGVTLNTPVVLGVFRLSEEKRPVQFVETFAAVVACLPDARAFIAGVGPFEERMRLRIQQLGLHDSLTLLGRRDDVPELMQIASLLLLTSSLEGMPNVVMEAQAYGLPVVASNVGGVSDCMIDRETGYLVDRENLNGFAIRCIELLKDEKLRIRFGRRGAEYMRGSFSRRAMAERYLEVLLEERETPMGEAEASRAVVV